MLFSLNWTNPIMPSALLSLHWRNPRRFLYRRRTSPNGVGGKAAYGSIRLSLEPVITTTWPIYT